MTEKPSNLTDKEELFCQEYLIDLNKTQAYIRAYDTVNYDSARTEASKTFAKPHILARIKDLMSERAQKMEISQDWVVLNLKKTFEQCCEGEEVLQFNPETKQMESIGKWQFDSGGANRSLELIGKHLGMFNPKLELSGSVENKTSMTPEQFEQLKQAAIANAITPDKG